MASKRKTSEVWNFFTEKSKSDKIAVCNICKLECSYKSTSNNLKKHIERRHIGVKLNTIQRIETETLLPQPEPQPSTSSFVEPDFNQLRTVNPALKQSNVATFVKRKISVSERKKIDDKLMLLFTLDYQPFSIVEDVGFRSFVNMLNPSYQLPSRKTITNTMLTAAYEDAYNTTKNIMRNVKAVTLTTDCWTSRNTENFLGVTAHFVDHEFQLKSVLLECCAFGDSHTSVNLAYQLQQVIDEWNLQGKVLIVISDNAANIKKAIQEELKLKHLSCYAHTLNLIALDAVKQIDGIVLKVKNVVAYFKRSTTANAKFFDQQRQLNKLPKKLIQDVPTRWNSTYYMLERFCELEEPIRTTMALVVNKNWPIFFVEEWELLKEIVKILKPLETVTNFVSGQKFVTASSIITLTAGLLDIYKQFEAQNLNELSKNIIKTILDGINKNERFGRLESSNSLILTTFLDPRFKSLGFSAPEIGKKAEAAAESLIVKNLKDVESEQLQHDTHDQGQTENNQFDGMNALWENFDKIISSFKPSGTARSKAIIEIQRYLEVPPIARTQDPLVWWKNNAYNYPNLAELVKTKFIPISSSVPCERLFSKAGQLLSERRNRLSSSKVKMILFINNNL